MKEVPDEFVSRFAVAGPPALCIDRLGEIIGRGLDRVVLLMGSRDADPQHMAASSERISAEVIVELR